MKRIKKPILVLLCLVMVFSLSFGLSSCGGDSGGGSGATGGGHMVIGTEKFVDTLNPLMSEWWICWELFNLIYDPLVRFDENLNPIPCLAESWELSDDQLAWTFHLADATWQDGEPFTSNDVKWTYEVMLNSDELGFMYVDYLDLIDEIICPDDKTVVIYTEEPKANMLYNTTPILPEHLWSQISEDELATYTNDSPVGTGPFKFEKSTDTQIFLSRNDDYFGQKANLDNLTFMVYKNADSMAQALKTGEIDATTLIAPDQKKALLGDENLNVIAGEVPGFRSLGFNIYDGKESTGNPLLKDKAIRHAIEYAIDKQKGLEMFHDNDGAVGTTLLNPSDKFHYEPTADELRSFDPDKAREILAQAGYKDTNGDGVLESKDGAKLSFNLYCLADKTNEVKFGQMIKSNCADVGIEIDLSTMDDGALGDKLAEFDYDMFCWGWGGDIDPTDLMGVLTSDNVGGSNEPGWVNKEYDKLIRQQMTAMDEAERIRLVQEAQKVMYEDAPYIILVYDNRIQAYRSDRWEGMEQIPAGGLYTFNNTIINYLNVKAK